MLKLSFWDVEQVILRGEKCPPEDLVALRQHIQTCILLVWAQCCDQDFYECRRNITVAAGESSFNLDDDTFADKPIHRLSSVMYRSCTNDANKCGCDEPCECKELCVVENICVSELAGQPENMEVREGVVYFDCPLEEETTFIVCYQRSVNCDIVVVNEAGIDEYQIPDIPPELYPVLIDHVRFRAFADNEDWGNAVPWNDIATQQFDVIKEALEKEHSGSSAVLVCMEKVECSPKKEKLKDREWVEPNTEYCGPLETAAGVRRSQRYLLRDQTI